MEILPTFAPAHRKSAVLAWLRLMRVHQKVERAAAEDLRQWDLSVPQFDILARLGAGGGMPQAQLAESRLTTKGNLSQLLENMESGGLIRRERDGRTKRVYLSVKGEALLAAATPGHEAAIGELFCPLSADELETLRRLLRKLDRAL